MSIEIILCLKQQDVSLIAITVYSSSQDNISFSTLHLPKDSQTLKWARVTLTSGTWLMQNLFTDLEPTNSSSAETPDQFWEQIPALWGLIASFRWRRPLGILAKKICRGENESHWKSMSVNDVQTSLMTLWRLARYWTIDIAFSIPRSSGLKGVPCLGWRSGVEEREQSGTCRHVHRQTFAF